MKDIPAVLAVYLEVDANFETSRETAIASSNIAKANLIEAKQALNDQAYFILVWGQMETAIDQACRSAIRRRRGSIDRNIRRAWELYNPEDRRLSGLSFEHRAALVLDKQADRPSHWSKLLGYYNARNQIAHGELKTVRIDIVDVIQDFFTIESALET